jgi:hypothetical protein
MTEQQREKFRAILEKRITKLPSGCWCVGKNRAYSVVRVGGRYYQSSRLFYEVFVGQIPKRHEVTHPHCRMRWCINPEHMAAETHVAVMRDSLASRASGQLTAISRFLMEQGLTSAKFAKAIGVSTTLVKLWRSSPGCYPPRDREDTILAKFPTFPRRPAAEGTA